MANAYEMFETDKGLEQNGVWVDYGAFRTKIAHAGGSNKKFSNLFDAMTKPYDRQMKAKIMDDDVASDIMKKVYAETIILDFEVKVEKEADGKTVTEWVKGVPCKADPGYTPFNKENVIRIFTELPKFFQDIQSQATDFAIFRVTELEEAIKK